LAQAGTAYIDFHGRYDKLNRQTDRAVKDVAKRFDKLNAQTDRAVQSRFAGLGSSISAGLGSATRDVGKVISVGLSTGLAATTALGAQAVFAGAQYNALGQRASAAMKTVLGSTEAATKMMGELMEFASASPFPRQLFVEATQQMLAFGFAAEDVIPTLGAVEDAVAAAGGSAQQIEEVVYVLSQIQSAGKITATDLMQLGQRGINAADLIGSSLGKSGKQIKESITEGTLDSGDAINALVDAMETQFGGAAANLKGTWTGAVQSIQARSRDLGAALVEPFIGFAGGGALVTGLGLITKSLAQFTATSEDGSVRFVGALEPMNAIAVKLADIVLVLLEHVAGLIDKLATFDATAVTAQFEGLAPAIGGVAAAIGVMLGSNLPFIGGFLGGINPLVAALGAMIALSPELRSVFGDALTQVFDAIKPLVEPALALFQSLAETLIPPLLSLLPTLTSAFEQLFVALEPVIPVLAGALAEAIASIAPILPDLVAGLVELTTGVLLLLIPLLPVLADLFVLLVPPLLDVLNVLVELLNKVPPPVLLALFASFFVVFKVMAVLFKFRLALTLLSFALGALGVEIPIFTKALGLVSAPSIRAAAGLTKAGLASRLASLFFPKLTAAFGMLRSSMGLVVTLIRGALMKSFALIVAHPVIAAIVAIGVALYLAYRYWEPFREAVDETWQSLQRLWDVVLAWIEPFLPALEKFGRAWLDYVLTPVMTIVRVVQRLLKGDFVGAIAEVVTMVPRMLIKMGRAIWLGLQAIVPILWDLAQRAAPIVLAWLSDAIDALPGLLADLLETIVDWVSNAASVVADAFVSFSSAALDWIGDAIAAVPGLLADFLGANTGWVRDNVPNFLSWASAALAWIGEAAATVGRALLELLETIVDWAFEHAPDVRDAFVAFGTAALSWVVDAAASVGTALVGLRDAILDWVVATVPQLDEMFLGFAWGALSWVGEAIASVADLLGDFVDAIESWVLDNAPDFLSWTVDALAWIGASIAKLGSLFADFVLAIGDWVITTTPDVAAAFVGWVGAASQWIVETGANLPGQAAEIIAAIWRFVQRSAESVGAFFAEWGPKAYTWVTDVVESMPERLQDIMNSIRTGTTRLTTRISANFVPWAQAAAIWITEFISALPGHFETILNRIREHVVARYQRMRDSFGPWISAAVDWLSTAIPALILKLSEFVQGIINWAWENKYTIARVLGIMFAVAVLAVPALILGLVLAIGYAVVSFALAITQVFLGWVGPALQWIRDVVLAIPTKLAEVALAISNWVQSTATSIATWVLAFVPAIWEWVPDAIGAATDRLGKIWDAIKEWLLDLPSKIKDVAVDIPGAIADKVGGASLFGVSPSDLLGIRPMAVGGYVGRPTAALIGEAGPELVLPLSDPKRMNELLARYAPVPAMANGGAVGASASATAAPDVSGVDAWAVAVVARLALLPDEIVAAMAPGLANWHAQITTTLAQLASSISSWLTTSVNALRIWASLTVGASTLPGLTIWSGRVVGIVTSMIAAVTAAMTAAIGAWSSLAARAAQGYVTQMTTKLGAGTTSIATIVSGYATTLANGVNPILTAIGAQPIRLADGGVVAYADGGMSERHVAQIAPAGAWRVWAEPETGGEAYIPLAKSKRRRSRAIASETVARLGGGVDWYAGGGITGDRRGLDPRFLARIAQWSAAVGQNFHIGSGYRSSAQQAVLYAKFLRGEGNLAAKPGSSMHNKGLAIDGPHWGNRNPGAFGLTYRVPGEPWHVEPIEARSWASGMPGDAFAFAPLADPPDVGRTGALGLVAAQLMRFVHDKAVDWTATALATAAGDAPGLAPMSGAALDIGQRMAAARGWTGPQWNALRQLWQKESGWSTTADNPTSSAYGIPQALPGSKMASHGADWRTNPQTQIAWGLDYIAGRYGSPAAAWAKSLLVGWYGNGGMAFVHGHDFDNGGVLRPGANLVQNNTGANEALVPARRGGAAVDIREAHFHEGVDYDLFLRKTAFMAQAGRI